MSQWVAAEMAACQRHDARHGKRLAQLVVRLGESPVRSMPSAGHGWAETVAAYRLLDNPALSREAILSGHKQATLDRIRRQAVVLLVQDTTLLNDGPTPPKAGMGTAQGKKRAEYLLHPPVAFTPARVN